MIGGGDVKGLYPTVDAYPEWPNLAAMLFDRAAAWPDRPMLRAFRAGGWQSLSWGGFARQAAAAARALRASGVAAGDRVVIVSDNRPEFPIAEAALMALRAVPVPAYVTNTVSDHAHVLRDCGAQVAIAATPLLAQRLLAAASGGLDLLVVMDDPPEGALAWSALVAADRPPDDIAAEARTIPARALACLIYTSGTGGAPKGVMLSHRAILSNCRGAFELLRPLRLRDEIYLSFLPLSHAFEHTAGQFFLLSIGTEIVYSRGVEHLAADMAVIHPSIMTMVPRVLELIRARVLAQLAREPAWRQALFHRALTAGLKRAEGRRLSPVEMLADPLLDRLVRGKLRARFGGRLRAAMCGGARLEPEVGRFFLALGLKVMQGYGQTEAGPVISANPPDAIRIETVGRALEGVALRIAGDGEILVAGDLVMDGYWGQTEATEAVIQDGWLHTGDVGELDADGYLTITDRKKDIIVLSGGETVSPARIEGILVAEPEIAQAVVSGEGQAGLNALVVATEGCSAEAVAHAVTRANQRLSVTERVRRHVLVPPFTLENGLLTPTQKVRRLQAVRAHAEKIEEKQGQGSALDPLGPRAPDPF